ncbi:MAG: adenine deaminase [Anaerolineales bacterium]
MRLGSWVRERSALIGVAMGRAPADLVIRQGIWVCVQTGELIPGTDIAVKGERIAYVGLDAKHTIGPNTQVIEANNQFLAPGLLDGHMHIESGMVTITEFVRAVAPQGTTGMFVDPHEMANVFGLKGVKLMVDEAARQPIHVWVQAPSCVPSAPGLETPGATLTAAEVAEAMAWEGVVGLGEMMDFPAVIHADKKMLKEMAAAAVLRKTIGGHYASPDLGIPFHAYAAGGPQDDHEGTRVEDAVARARQGMKVLMRFGSSWYDVAAQVKAVTELGLDPRNFLLCTDDSHSGTLIDEGHMNRVVRHAIQQGLKPVTAWQMASLNTAEHFGFAHEVGQIAPGRVADILLLNDLEEVKIDIVIAKGSVVAEGGKLTIDLPETKYPKWASKSLKLGHPLTAKDFVLKTKNEQTLTANVIGVIENQAPTRHLRIPIQPNNGEIHIDVAGDLAKVALVERHRGTGGVQVGLVRGFGLKASCALASTVAHDSHHMIVVGTSESDMALAANELARVGGGQIVVKDGRVLALVELPIGGLMSAERAEVVARKADRVLAGFKACGCQLNNPNMQLSLLALVVIPELRISDLGLVDVTKGDFIPVLEEIKN